MRYEAPAAITRADAQATFGSGSPNAVAAALVRVALHDPDWRYIQGQCMTLLAHAEPAVRATAATCLGHVARLHRSLDLDVVLPRLMSLTKDEDIGGEAQDAIDDILTFIAPLGRSKA